ncbi:helix-turn-helix domain-containing protein [Cupriavidus sp. RAF12]
MSSTPATYPIRIISQLRPVLQGFRKSRGLTQAELAARLGVSQQTYARLEANPDRVSMARLLAVLQALEVDLQLSPRPGDADPGRQLAGGADREAW